jgi:hypothetical protein
MMTTMPRALHDRRVIVAPPLKDLFSPILTFLFTYLTDLFHYFDYTQLTSLQPTNQPNKQTKYNVLLSIPAMHARTQRFLVLSVCLSVFCLFNNPNYPPGYTHILKPNDTVVPNFRRGVPCQRLGALYHASIIRPRPPSDCRGANFLGRLFDCFAWTRLRFALAQGVLESIAHSYSNERHATAAVFDRPRNPFQNAFNTISRIIAIRFSFLFLFWPRSRTMLYTIMHYHPAILSHLGFYLFFPLLFSLLSFT